MHRLALVLSLTLAAPVAAAPCGGDFGGFIQAMKSEALSQGLSPDEADRFFAGAKTDSRVIKADRSQGVFRKTFSEFSGSLISKSRIQNGAANAKKYRKTFDRAQSQFGVPPGILLSFWAFETDFGAVQGD